jgi:galactose mutarotase-like enzyme
MGKTESGSSASNLIGDPIRDSGPDSIEQILLENNVLRVTVLPSLGGKIASIQLAPGGEELLQKPLRAYAPRAAFMSFDASDASGWDECLPSVAACEVQTASGAASIPDHGDFWQVAWRVVSQSGTELTLSADGFSLPLRFSKTLRLDGNRLGVSYSVRNLGSEPLEYVWSAHPLFVVEQGDRIVLPSSVQEVVVEGSALNRLGIHGTKHTWPKTTLADQEICDLGLVGNAADEIGDKLFTAAPAEGWCAIERKRLERRIELHFDAQQLPYLGLWICYGGWPERQEKRQYCVALEPCTAEGDSLAIAANERRARQLAPAGEDHWSLVLQVSGVS